MNDKLKTLSKLLQIMMQYYNNVHYSEHALKVYAYAHNIAVGENLSEGETLILSAAAILHDIGIPRAIKLHGSAKAEFQEKEGALLVPELLKQAGVHNDIRERVSWLVGHHHTEALAEKDLLLQILMEADYLVNLAGENTTTEKRLEVSKAFFKTGTGKQYITALFNL